MKTSGNLGTGGTASAGTPQVVAGVSDATGLSVGLSACALRADASIVCWGRGTEGQLGTGSATSSPAPVAVVGLP
mgnify:CR=1 FL=1